MKASTKGFMWLVGAYLAGIGTTLVEWNKALALFLAGVVATILLLIATGVANRDAGKPSG